MTDALCILSQSKSIVIAAEASQSLKVNCKMYTTEYLENTTNIDSLIKTILIDLNGKRQPFSRNAKFILKEFKDKMGDQPLKDTAKEILQNDNDVKKIMQAFLVKKDQDSSKAFRDFLKKKKSAKGKGDETADQVFAK
jgi:hypothetical protein